MPFYTYKCDECGSELEELRCMASRDSLPLCYCTVKSHGAALHMNRVIDAPQVKVVNPAVPPGKKRNI